MAGRHAVNSSQERKIAIAILSVGTLVVVASLFGGEWVIRAGAVLAVGMAFAAVMVAWGELRRERAEHAESIRYEVNLRKEQAARHHADALAMIERFNGRAEKLQEVIDSLRRQLGSANSELSTMRGNAVWLRSEVSERQARIDTLQTRIAELEAQLASIQAAKAEVEEHPENTENIVELLVPEASDVEDLWEEGEDPTMVHLQKMALIVREEAEPVRKQA